jgi:signal transduction histidine kinase
VSQTLVVIRNWAQTGQPPLPPDHVAEGRLDRIADAASQALGEVREVVQGLLPCHLERLGLTEAVRETVARVADASGIPITCTLAEVRGRLSDETALRLFRVVQESLNNVVKHSRATSASLEMSLGQDGIRVALHDNGRGFDPAQNVPTQAGHGFGLVGMAERTRMMGGVLTVDAAPGRGTTITVVVPCAGAREAP